MQNYVNMIFSLISLVLLWTMLWLYKDYSVEAFRQKLFALRDEMFDMAAKGEIPFNHKGYGRLRVTMNGSIRFAEEISLLRILLFHFLRKKHNIHNASYKKDFLSEIEDLPYEQYKIFTMFNRRFNEMLIKQMVANSPIMILTFIVPLTVYLTLKSASSWFRNTVVPWLMKCITTPLDEIQALAYTVGRD